MKSTIIRAAAAFAVLTVAGAAPLAAQVASPIGFNVRAGAALPVGKDSDGIKTGFTLGAGLSFRPPLMPIGLRFDGDFNRFGVEDFSDVNVSIWSLTANAELAPAMSPIYFIGGLGMYSSKVNSDVGASDSETDLGFNAGAGFRLPLTGFNTFVEARYHRINHGDTNGVDGGSTAYVPITFGIAF